MPNQHTGLLRRGYIDDQGTGHIPLTRGKETLCNARWFHILSRNNWCARRDSQNGRWYAVRTVRLSNCKNTTQYMARVIMGVTDPKIQIDHKDRSPEGGLDNREENLRIATSSQNQSNRAAQTRNTSGFVGASWKTANSRWVSQIRHNGKNIHLGYFRTAVEAAAIWNWSARRLYGEFAYQNDLSQITEAQVERSNNATN